MNHIKCKPTRKEIDDTLDFYAFLSGKKAETLGCEGYARFARELESKPLDADAYEKKKKAAADICGM